MLTTVHYLVVPNGLFNVRTHLPFRHLQADSRSWGTLRTCALGSARPIDAEEASAPQPCPIELQLAAKCPSALAALSHSLLCHKHADVPLLPDNLQHVDARLPTNAFLRSLGGDPKGWNDWVWGQVDEWGFPTLLGGVQKSSQGFWPPVPLAKVVHFDDRVAIRGWKHMRERTCTSSVQGNKYILIWSCHR
jgi:hypothetical protein